MVDPSGLLRRIDRLLIRLAQLGIAVFLLISAFDIHRWRREPWQAFESGFQSLAGHIFGQPPQPVWLYALAFPFVAVNFGCLVQIIRKRTDGLLPAFLTSASFIAIMPVFAWQVVIERMVWEQILIALGYSIGGAIAVLLALRSSLRLDSLGSGTRAGHPKKEN